MLDFNQYIKELQSIPIEEITEHSKRFALETLLRELASNFVAVNKKNIKVLHEPKRKENYGSPDFKIYTDNSIIGYVENKKITENLDKILKSDQIKKYRELSQNILLTNYIEFIWIKGDTSNPLNNPMIQRETLCTIETLTAFKTLSGLNTEKVEKLLVNFFSQPPIGISTPKDLASSLAVRGKNLKDFLFDELQRQEIEYTKGDLPYYKGKLYGIYLTFKENISSDLTLSEFADAFAQMLAYGLFLAKLNAGTKEVTLKNAEDFIPLSFALIKELVSFLDELEKVEYLETKWIVEEIISMMNNLELQQIQQSLSYSKKPENSSIEKDPYIYFYEDFLAAYDSKLRKAKGVYYTPPQVVNFIISSINQILKSDFDIYNGIENHKKITCLDFATGTGTFLYEIFRQILDNILPTNQAAKDLIIKEHLLKNMYGFEYLIAPYTIAHLKLSQLLKEHNYTLQERERIQVFLTNTLEPVNAKPNLFLQMIANEGVLAEKVKASPILVITGNPPYSISSSNKHPAIIELLKAYKEGLNEQKINIDDDYIKFIRFAHDKISKCGKGVVAIITNNSYLDGITHRKMREKIYHDFDKIYIINLHGNSLKNEGDENVFDIRVGVAISIFIKTEKPLTNKEVYYYSTKDNKIITRNDKYDYLLNNRLENLNFIRLQPEKPYFWFVSKDLSFEKEYKKYYSINQIFRIYSAGFETQKDELTIHFTSESFLLMKNDLIKMPEHLFRQKYNLKDSRDWKYNSAKEELEKSKDVDGVNYRIFDRRYSYYSKKSKGFIAYPRNDVMQHIKNHENISLVTTRQLSSEYFNHVFISDLVCERCYISNKTKEANYIFPLYLFEKIEGLLIDIPDNELTKLAKDFEKAKSLYEKRTKEYVKIINPTVHEKDFYEEAVAFFEEIKTNYEIKLTQIETKRLDSILPQNVEFLKTPNFTDDFKKFISKQYFNEDYSPEQILGYIYAILHSPTYRKKYYEFLKIEFPRIPFTENADKFEKLSEIGNSLIQKHLLNNIPNEPEYQNLGIYSGHGDSTVIKPDYRDNKLFINKEQFFDNVPINVINFKIGCYQPLDKFLKERKTCKLSLEDTETIKNIIKVVAFTIKQLDLIDKETKDWI
jgi:hypothetical protein